MTHKILKKTITEKHATLRLSSFTNQGKMFYSELHTWSFHRLGLLGRVGHRVAMSVCVPNRPGVAGAVLQTPS